VDDAVVNLAQQLAADTAEAAASISKSSCCQQHQRGLFLDRSQTGRGSGAGIKIVLYFIHNLINFSLLNNNNGINIGIFGFS